MTLKECKVCGKGFYGHHASKFCSSWCREEIYPKSKRLKLIKCTVCGDGFTPKTARHITCSSECSKANHANNSKKRHAKKKVNVLEDCYICKKSFVVSSVNRKTCSKKCSLDLKKLRKREECKRYRSKPEVRNRRKTENVVWSFNNPSCDIRSMLRRQLGEDPPEELVEEATMLRLLRRAIRN